eukprot:g28562.t1
MFLFLLWLLLLDVLVLVLAGSRDALAEQRVRLVWQAKHHRSCVIIALQTRRNGEESTQRKSSSGQRMEYTSGAMVDREQSVNATCCSEDELGATEHEEEEDSLEETGAIATNPRQDGKQRQQQQQQDLERSRQDDMVRCR